MASWYQEARLTRDLRETLKQRIDQAVRAALPAEPRCAGCGVELLDAVSEAPRYVEGCPTCTDRRIQRTRRELVTT